MLVLGGHSPQVMPSRHSHSSSTKRIVAQWQLHSICRIFLSCDVTTLPYRRFVYFVVGSCNVTLITGTIIIQSRLVPELHIPMFMRPFLGLKLCLTNVEYSKQWWQELLDYYLCLRVKVAHDKNRKVIYGGILSCFQRCRI